MTVPPHDKSNMSEQQQGLLHLQSCPPDGTTTGMDGAGGTTMFAAHDPNYASPPLPGETSATHKKKPPQPASSGNPILMWTAIVATSLLV
ncbi:unnamed protein product, partial [Amoebophrya sp. A25]|eukprot:GSA25T00003003001.1